MRGRMRDEERRAMFAKMKGRSRGRRGRRRKVPSLSECIRRELLTLDAQNNTPKTCDYCHRQIPRLSKPVRVYDGKWWFHRECFDRVSE